MPTIAHWPGHIKPDSASDHPAYFGDLMATAAELLGVSAPGQLDSVSILPTLIGQADRQLKREFLYWEFLERRGAQAVVLGETGRWKALRKQSATAPIEIYDLDNDLGPTTTLTTLLLTMSTTATQAPTSTKQVSQLRFLSEDATTAPKIKNTTKSDATVVHATMSKTNNPSARSQQRR